MMRSRWTLLFAGIFSLALAVGLFAVRGGKAAPAGLTRICQIQGKAFSSSYQNKSVRVAGIVTADLDSTSRRGFFLQEQSCDDDTRTSDALFVQLDQRMDLVQAGDRVEVAGLVEEYGGQTRLKVNTWEVFRISTGEALPAPVDATPPFSPVAARSYWESLEAMSIRVQESIVVGPTDSEGRTWVAPAGLGLERLFMGEAGGEGAATCVDDGGLFEISPPASVGERVSGLAGVLEHRDEIYCLQLFSPPGPVLPKPATNPSGPGQPAQTSLAFTAATFNLANLYDAYDDPAVDDDVLSATEYQRRLEKRSLTIHESLLEPDLIAVQEVENEVVLKALLARPEIEATYAAVWENGPDLRGLDSALLYRTDRLVLRQSWSLQICTDLIDGLGPDGNQNVFQPANTLTCDLNGDGILNGNRLFSRPPLVATFQFCAADCTMEWGGAKIWVINNHWKSRVEDGYAIAFTAPRREQEAQQVGRLAQEILSTHPNVTLLVMGDMNDEPGSLPLSHLLGLGLSNPWNWLPAIDRYSYIYHGISQTPDYILLRPAGPLWPAHFRPIPINADYPSLFATVPATVFRSSDHNPLVLEFRYHTYRTWLPAVAAGPGKE